MDTRSTKFKYSVFAKGLCLLLAILTFFSFAFFATKALWATQILGMEEFFSGKYPSFTQSYGFRSKFSEDFYHVRTLLTSNADSIDAAFSANKDLIITDAVNSYLDQKAKIIEDELRYAVDNYDESYFIYEYTADAIVIPEDVSGTEKTTDTVTNDVPRNIQAAQKILQSVKGRDFLKYSALVRDSAFNSNEFNYETVINISENFSTSVRFTNQDFYPDETAIKKQFLKQYEDYQSNAKDEAQSDAEISGYILSKLKAFRYYAVDEKGLVYSNMENKPTLDKMQMNDAYVFYDGADVTIGKLENDQKKYINNILSDTKNCEIYIYVEDKQLNTCNDSYSYLYTSYNNLINTNTTTLIVVTLLSLAVSAALFIVFMCLCGHKNGEEKCVTAFIDKIPTDLHFLLSFGCIAGLTALAVIIAVVVTESINGNMDLFLMYAPWGISALLTSSYGIFIEWFASTVRIKKAGQKFFSKMLITKLIFATGRLLKKLILKSKRYMSIFMYKPRKIKRSVILSIFGYTLGNIVLIISGYIFAYSFYEEIAILFFAITTIIYNGICLFFILKYFINLDRIIDASCNHEYVDFGSEKIPESLRLLATNLTDTNKAMHEAVAKAIRDEQLKTELITNVSHDLKTPLTSLISYSDLLEKCDIQDETAKKYISVINAQSIKLKRLIEDLIEASKVSTGNVTINTAKLNLSELTIQAIAEFAPEMEKNGNEIIFNEPEKPPIIFADGSKTYRILSNLLSNAKKYSAPDTRVYVSVYTDNNDSYFEIKNISCEPLNISAEELTERFVRGDKSRSREGNGLGLSIAKDLCTLQNGNLSITIDGDLFKVIVQLPAANKTT